MRWRGLEPPRGVNPTRPSTLRVYQFRHQRAGRIVAAPTATRPAPITVRAVRELCEQAVAAALAGGASYADARAVHRRSQVVATRNQRVERLDDVESEGIGVRVLVDGAWGFACDRRLTEQGAREAAARACAFARAAPSADGRALAPITPAQAHYVTARERDPIEVPLEEKVGLCIAAEEALQLPQV